VQGTKRHTDDGDIVLGGLELPESDINGDTTLALGLELVKNPGILEGALAELSSLLCFLSACVAKFSVLVGLQKLRGCENCALPLRLSAPHHQGRGHRKADGE